MPSSRRDSAPNIKADGTVTDYRTPSYLLDGNP